MFNKAITKKINRISKDFASVFGYDLPTATKLLKRHCSNPSSTFGYMLRFDISYTDEERNALSQFYEQHDYLSMQKLILDVIDKRVN